MEENSHSLESLLGDESFHRWVLNESKKGEAEYWEQWIKVSSENRVLADKAGKILLELKIVSKYQPDAVKQLKKLNQRIDDDRSSTLMLPFERRRKSKFWNTAFRYAAVILIAALAGLGYWLHSNSQSHVKTEKVAMLELNTKYGEQKVIKLSDGSQIYLAPNSHLRYASNWLSQPIRKLYLDGEAYFDIIGTRQPGKAEFEIQTDDGIIRDLGTQFNVSTFNNQTSVVLRKGLVTIKAQKNKESEEVRLQRGQMASIHHNDTRVNVTSVNPEVYTSWTTNLLVFDHTPLNTFIQMLKDLYGVDVVVKEPSLLNKELTGDIEKQSLSTILTAVSRVLNLNVYQRGQTVFIDSNVLDKN